MNYYVKALLLGTAAVGMLVTAGCYRNPSNVTMHSPGVYKGSTDPLIAKLKTPALTRALDNRATVAFQDR